MERLQDRAGWNWTEVETLGPLEADSEVHFTDPSPPADGAVYRIGVSLAAP